MIDGQMTQTIYQNNRTVMVHSLLSSNKQSNRVQSNQMRSQIIPMNYQQYMPANYQTDIQQRIRCRSFYSQKSTVHDMKTKSVNKKKYQQAIEHQSTSRQPKVIDVQFQFFRKSKSKKDQNKICSSPNQCYSLMADSMQKYITKVQLGKKKKKQKCQRIKHFGVDIKSINYSLNSDIKRDIIFNNTITKIKADDSLTLKNGNDGSLINTSLNQTLNSAKNHKMSTLEPLPSTMNTMIRKSMYDSIPSTLSNNSNRPKFYTKKLSIKTTVEKKQEEKGIISRFKRMCNFFNIVLASYGVSLNRTQENEQNLQQSETKLAKKKQKYSYYIGKGNNKNLIISILKKRWWWVEAEDMSSADFVWTQIKVTTILCKQPSMNYSDLEEARPQIYKRTTSDKKFPANPLLKIFHENHSSIFYQKLSERQQKKYLRPMKIPSVLHNHYQANFMLGNKKALFYNMTQYKNFRNEDPFEYIPLTFHIERINSKAYRNFEKASKQNKKSLWIVKPGENSNRGQGIFVTDSLQKIKNKIMKDMKHTYIVQKYLKNNLTFQRRKFDIRTYLLLVSIGGVKKFFWYSEGYLRTSSEIYDLSDLDDPFVHLTNDAIQVKSDNYGKFEKGNKVTYHQFQRYLDLNYPDQKYSVPNLVQKMKAIAKQVAQATYFRIDPCKKQSGFQLYGMDFLIDSQFKPWLLEVNTNPCLELSSPVLERLIPRMLENMFRIAVDPIFQPHRTQLPRALSCYIPENIFDNNRFQLIFDALYDRSYQWQESCMINAQQQAYEDEDEQFEDDGNIIKIDD